jgi:catechol 2,3-dioxygenase-like lactoylglutathione lyase family enzyme
MQLNTTADARPEAMGDVPGICELPLTRAVVQYRDLHEMDTPGGRIEDIGLALVVEGRYAATSEVVDLGSGSVKVLDLSTELVVLDWVYEPTVDHVGELITASAAARDDDTLRRYSRALGLRILERVGFGPLTRPTFLRVGFRDICRDLDLHEGTSIRLVLGPGRLTRAHLDYDACALVFRTAFREPDVAFEHALAEAFPDADLGREEPAGNADAITYHVRFPLPTRLREARAALAGMRRGLAALVARFEPDRYASLARLMETFGARETLAGLRIHEADQNIVVVPPPSAGSHVVH